MFEFEVQNNNYVDEIFLSYGIMFYRPLEYYISYSMTIACAHIFAYRNLYMFAVYMIIEIVPRMLQRNATTGG